MILQNKYHCNGHINEQKKTKKKKEKKTEKLNSNFLLWFQLNFVYLILYTSIILLNGINKGIHVELKNLEGIFEECAH